MERCATLNFGQMSESKIIPLLLICDFTLTDIAKSKINPHDSVDIKNQIEGFYSWYIDVIKNEKIDKAFSPNFVRRKDGMTTLDFTEYQNGLRKYKFTEDFIQRKTNEYNDCVYNLNKIPFEKFSELEDLGDFEEIDCDFSNRYEWTGGQESKDKAELTSLKFVDRNTIIGQVVFISYGRPDGGATVTLKKIKNEWKVNNIQV
jgi:hypothetical protein